MRANGRELLFEGSIARLQIFDPLAERLYRGQRDAVAIDLEDRLVVRADVKGRHEVLRHRADVACVRAVALEAPARDGERIDGLQDLVVVHRGEVTLHVAVAHVWLLARAAAKPRAAVIGIRARRVVRKTGESTRSAGARARPPTRRAGTAVSALGGRAAADHARGLTGA